LFHSGWLWQGRFFDRALRTVKEYNETAEYIRWNPVRRGLLVRPEEWTPFQLGKHFGTGRVSQRVGTGWKWSSVHEYGLEKMADPSTSRRWESTG